DLVADGDGGLIHGLRSDRDRRRDARLIPALVGARAAEREGGVGRRVGALGVRRDIARVAEVLADPADGAPRCDAEAARRAVVPARAGPDLEVEVVAGAAGLDAAGLDAETVRPVLERVAVALEVHVGAGHAGLAAERAAEARLAVGVADG